MSDSKLNQILAVEKGVKSRNGQAVTEGYHLLQKNQLLSGLTRTYRPKDDEGDQYPGESTKVQAKADQVLSNISDAFSHMWDVVATKEWGNTQAKGTIKIDGQVILADVPVTFLLPLEKDLVDFQTFISKLPTLDPAEEWEWDDAQDCYKSAIITTTKQKKVPRNHVKAEATDKHPAQVEVYYEDILQGYWDTTKFSGAVTNAFKNQLLERVAKFRQAVLFAREEANSLAVENKSVGKEIFDYLLA